MSNLRNISRRFSLYSLWIVGGLTLVGLLVARVWYLDWLIVPVIVSALFSLLVCGTIAYVWFLVAKNSPENLPTFYTAESGTRFLLALGTMLAYYLVDKQGIKTFICVFLVYYFIMLLFTAIFFSVIAKRSDKQ